MTTTGVILQTAFLFFVGIAVFVAILYATDRLDITDKEDKD